MATVLTGERIGKQGRLTVGCSATIFDAIAQKILLVRRSDNGQWCVPGGYMEPGENVAEAYAREVLEETGWQVEVDDLSMNELDRRRVTDGFAQHAAAVVCDAFTTSD